MKLIVRILPLWEKKSILVFKALQENKKLILSDLPVKSRYN
jgi:hypothetical protein